MKKYWEPTSQIGVGFRVSIWLTGCPIHCRGCFNSQLWDKNVGKLFNQDAMRKIVEELEKDWCEGVSVLGGEPLADWNLDATREITRQAWKIGKNSWVWTGYLFEHLNSLQLRALEFTDVLIDRPIHRRAC